MLKGKTKVELFDAETGKLVKSVEKHNEITSAYQRLINHLFYTGGILNEARGDQQKSFLKDVFGGIIMFDSDVPDGAIVQDKTNHCTGMAFYNQSESNYDKVGSYNSQESSIDYDKKTATFVYDFATSQANGVVKSICLCNKDITMLNGLNTSDTSVSSSRYRPLYFDKDNKMMFGTNYDYNNRLRNYYISYPVSGTGSYFPPLNNAYATIVVFLDIDNGVRYGIRFDGNKKFYAVKQYVAQNKWSAFVDTSQSYWQDRYNVTKEETVEVDLSGIYGGFETSGNYVKCFITGYKGVMYIMPVISSTQSGGTNLSILKYDFNNFGMESNEASFFNVLIPTGYSIKANYDSGFHVDSEYVYYVVTNGTDYFVAKSSMTNNADSKILQKIDVQSGNRFPSELGGWMPGTYIYNYSNYKAQFINLDDGSKSYDYLDNNNYYYYAFYIYDFRTDYIYYMREYRSSSSYSSYSYYYYDYTLKSINNLTDAITKTNSNTMKITYTLTETDS
jgi:hypothetical protein